MHGFLLSAVARRCFLERAATVETFEDQDPLLPVFEPSLPGIWTTEFVTDYSVDG